MRVTITLIKAGSVNLDQASYHHGLNLMNQLTLIFFFKNLGFFLFIYEIRLIGHVIFVLLEYITKIKNDLVVK